MKRQFTKAERINKKLSKIRVYHLTKWESEYTQDARAHNLKIHLEVLQRIK